MLQVIVVDIVCNDTHFEKRAQITIAISINIKSFGLWGNLFNTRAYYKFMGIVLREFYTAAVTIHQHHHQQYSHSTLDVLFAFIKSLNFLDARNVLLNRKIYGNV